MNLKPIPKLNFKLEGSSLANKLQDKCLHLNMVLKQKSPKP